MPGWHVYAIVERLDTTELAGRGFGGAPLVSISWREIAAVVSRTEMTKVQALPATVRHHEAIVEALMTASAVLPVRFGTLSPNTERVRELLAAHHRSFVATLERVRGRVELGFRVLWSRDEGLMPTSAGREGVSVTPSGRQYLMARLEQERRVQALRQSAQDLAEALHCPLAGLAIESTREILRTPRMLLSAAYLVDRARVGRLQAEVASLASLYTQLQFLLTGPWPPYHFVTGCVPAGLSSVEEGAGPNVLA